MASTKTRKPAKKAAKPRTEKQREASRRNAQLSTGPRTEAGKAASSRNAWKTGEHSAIAKATFAQHGATAMAKLWGKPCLTTCPMHPDNPEVESPCRLVLDGLTRAGGNCLDKTVFVQAMSALVDAMENGELGGVQAMLAVEGGKVMQLLHEMLQEVVTNGLSIAIPAITKDGEVVYDKDGKPVIVDYKANPMLGYYLRTLSEFGVSLPEMLATPKARATAKVGEQNADTFQSMLGRIMQQAGPMGAAPGRQALDHDDA